MNLQDKLERTISLAALKAAGQNMSFIVYKILGGYSFIQPKFGPSQYEAILIPNKEKEIIEVRDADNKLIKTISTAVPKPSEDKKASKPKSKVDKTEDNTQDKPAEV